MGSVIKSGTIGSPGRSGPDEGVSAMYVCRIPDGDQTEVPASKWGAVEAAALAAGCDPVAFRKGADWMGQRLQEFVRRNKITCGEDR